MIPNPILKMLGFSNTDRVAILHTDDIGMCQASLAVFIDLWENEINLLRHPNCVLSPPICPAGWPIITPFWIWN